MNTWTHTPVNCVWFTCFTSLLLGLLAFAGPAAIGAIFSLVPTGQFVAYSIPITCRFLGEEEWVPGPFTLGRLVRGSYSVLHSLSHEKLQGLPVAIVALLWMAFSIVILMFPTTSTVESQDMNYTALVLGGWLLLCVAYYYFPKYGGVYWFKGPVANIGEVLRSEASSESVDGLPEKEKPEQE